MTRRTLRRCQSTAARPGMPAADAASMPPLRIDDAAARREAGPELHGPRKERIMRLRSLCHQAMTLAVLALSMPLMCPAGSASDFTPPDGTVVSRTAGLLILENTLMSLQGQVADVQYTANLARPSSRQGIIVTVGDGSDFGSRRMLFMPVTCFPSSSWYERDGGYDGRMLTINYFDFRSLGGRGPTPVGADFCRWVGMDQRIRGLYNSYRGAWCYRLVENFPPGQSLASINQFMELKQDQSDAEQWCFTLDVVCSLIPGVNTAVLLTQYPIMSREVISGAISDAATIIPGALVLKGGRVISLAYVKGSFVAANIGMGTYDFQQAQNNQQRVLALLNIAGGCLDLADTVRATKCGPKLQRPTTNGARELRMFDNLIGDEAKAAKGAVNPLSGAPISSHLDSSVLGIKRSMASWERSDLPRKSPLIKDVRAYLQDYVGTLPDGLQQKILQSGEWQMIMNTSYCPKMVFATADYKSIPLASGPNFQFDDWTGGSYLRTKSGEKIIFMNPNWPDNMILVTAFHESLHSWRYQNPKGRAKDKLICSVESYSNQNKFWQDNSHMMLADESLAQFGGAQFYTHLKDWGMAYPGDAFTEPLDIVAVMNMHTNPGDLRMNAVNEYLLTPGTGHGYLKSYRDEASVEMWNNLRAYCRNDANWVDIANAPKDPAQRFALFQGQIFFDAVDATAP